MSRAQMRAAAMVTAGAVVVAMAGCSASSHSGAVRAAARIVDPPIGTVFDGVTLQGIIGGAAFPVGYSVSGADEGNSGPSIAVNGANTYASLSCADAAADLGNPGFGESSFAGQAVTPSGSTPGSSGSDSDEFVTAVYQYTDDSGAKALYAAVVGSWSQCGSFTVGQGANQVTVALHVGLAGPVPGSSKAADLQTTLTAPGGVAESVDQVIALDGDTVVITGVLVSAASGGGSAVSSAAGMDGSVLAAMNTAQLSRVVPTGGSSLASVRVPAGK